MDFNKSYNNINLSSSRYMSRNWPKIHCNFEPHFCNVLRDQLFGLKCGKILINDVSSSYGTSDGDRFTITIPYANQSLNWMIYFNMKNPELGPDFDFFDKSFLSDPNLHDFEKHVPSLVHWNYHDSESLLKVISELIIYYKKYQIEKLSNHGNRLVYEYQMLISKTEICDQDVEIILLPSAVEPTEIHLLIRLAVDFSRLPKKNYLSNYDIVLLHIIYRGSNWMRITPQLLLTSNLEDILGNVNNFHLPPFSNDKQLLDYVIDIKKLVNKKIDSIMNTHEKKKDFINTALCLQSKSIVEYDNIEYNYMHFLLNHNDFYFFVHFDLTPFPIHPPKITLQSCYHLASKEDLYKTVVSNTYAYNSSWKPEQMFTEMVTHIIRKEIELFKTNSIKNKRN